MISNAASLCPQARAQVHAIELSRSSIFTRPSISAPVSQAGVDVQTEIAVVVLEMRGALLDEGLIITSKYIASSLIIVCKLENVA